MINRRCDTCRGQFVRGSETTEFEGKFYHPDCFNCAGCHQQINDKFYHVDDKYICNRCYKRSKPTQICCKCQNEITSSGVSFNQNIYHDQCFGCSICSQLLTAQVPINIINGAPVCRQCFEFQYGKTCHSCKQKIGLDVEYVEYDCSFWHKKCFNCSKCQKSIAETMFYEDHDKFLCLTCAQQSTSI